MPFTTITAPAVGDPTRQTLASDIISNLTYLYGLILAAIGNREIVLNGSFETDSDSSGVPDGWTRTLYTGGSFTYETSSSAADGKAIHGKRSVKFTSPGGGGNGGGYVVSESFFEVTEGRRYRIEFATKSSAADVHNTASITWYDCTQASISTTTFHDDAAANPTSWREYEYFVLPPANARYAKLTFTGCKDDDTTAGSTWFDDIRVSGLIPPFENRVIFDVAGSYKWKCPSGASLAMVICIGGGGGGGGTASGGGTNGGGGGGAGGMAYDLQVLTAGTVYALACGAGGAGGTGGAVPTDGSNGSASSFTGSASLAGNGGSGGVKGSGTGAGGTGGSASGGRVNSTGSTGSNRATTTGGDGGEAPYLGASGAGGASGSAGTSGVYGGGGGGGGGAGMNGGNGSPGMVIVVW